jgi:hypothetical protein
MVVLYWFVNELRLVGTEAVLLFIYVLELRMVILPCKDKIEILLYHSRSAI